MDTYLIAVDTSKHFFQIRGVDRMGRCLFEKKLQREAFKAYIVNLNPTTIVIEVGPGSHYWGRFFFQHGHTAKLIPANFVKPFVKSQKNDRADAEGIAEAALRPTMRFVSVKDSSQQDLQNLHRIRERLIRQRTCLSNQLRGLLVEYGILIPQGIRHVAKTVPSLIEEFRSILSELAIITFKEMYEEFQAVTVRVDSVDDRITRYQLNDETCRRLTTIPGVGVLTATAIMATAVDPKQCKNGRAFSAALGLVPRQFSTGGKTTLGKITKRGNSYIRKLLVHGARSVIMRCDTKKDSRSLWVQKILATKGCKKAAVALANKNARVIWCMLMNPDMKYQAQMPAA